MFDTEIDTKLEDKKSYLADLLAIFDISASELDNIESKNVDNKLINDINILSEKVNHLRDILYRKYDYEQSWIQEGYRDASQAISHLTHCSSYKVKRSLKRSEFLEEFPEIKKAFLNNDITSEHVEHLAKIYGNNFYMKYFEKDIDLLLENAKNLTANNFAVVIKQYKYNIADIEEDLSDNETVLERYERRNFGMWKTPNGDYMFEGCFDQATGEIVEKTLTSVTSHIWENSSPQIREDFYYGKQNVDAINYIFKGFLASEYSILVPKYNAGKINKDYYQQYVECNFKPALTADITIDLNQISTNPGMQNDTNKFLANLLTRTSPLTRAYSRKYLDQIMCDSIVSFPMFLNGEMLADSKSVRTAPRSLKRQLALEHPFCYIRGCGCPAKWCDAHHMKKWSEGGPTIKENMILLCQRHHSKLHNDKHFEKNILNYLYKDNKIIIKT